MDNWWKEYKEYLKSDHWKKTRKAAFRKYGKKCDICSKKKKRGLQVHHLEYPKDFRAVTLDQLRILCKDCHDFIHLIKKENPLLKYYFLKEKVLNLIKKEVIIKPKKNRSKDKKKEKKLTYEDYYPGRFKFDKNAPWDWRENKSS